MADEFWKGSVTLSCCRCRVCACAYGNTRIRTRQDKSYAFSVPTTLTSILIGQRMMQGYSNEEPVYNTSSQDTRCTAMTMAAVEMIVRSQNSRVFTMMDRTRSLFHNKHHRANLKHRKESYKDSSRSHNTLQFLAIAFLVLFLSNTQPG